MFQGDHVLKHVQHYKEVMDHLLSNFRDNALVQIQLKIHSIAAHDGDFVFVRHPDMTGMPSLVPAED